MDQAKICEVCYENPTDFKLICQHSFCKNCLMKYLDSKIRANQFSNEQLICMQENCKKPINSQQIREILPPYLFEKYEGLKKKYFEDGPSELHIEEEKKIEKDINNKENCLSNDHGKIKNNNLENKDDFQNNLNENIDAEKIFQKQAEKESFQNYIEANGLKKCPVCKAWIEKIGNACDFIVCSSLKCSLKTKFCYVCGEHISSKDKDHFSNERCKKNKQITNPPDLGYMNDSRLKLENSQVLPSKKNEEVKSEPYCFLI